MRNARIGLSAALALSLAACSGSYGSAVGVDAVAGLEALPEVTLTEPPTRDPSELQVLFWSDEQRNARFRDMESWFAGHEVPASLTPSTLEKGAPLSASLQTELRAYIQESNAAGIMVLQGGKVRFEEYGLGMSKDDRWTSFSVAKSFTSTLLGAAVKDGFIRSLDDPVTNYISELKGSAYEGVTVEQIATMTSGVAWNEDYTDPESDVSQLNRFVVEFGPDAIVEQMKRLKREAPAGEKFVYKTGETNLLGLIVENASGLPLAEYSQTKIVEPAGLEGAMFWMTDPRGGNIGGCCLSLRLSDYARVGEFVRKGGIGTDGEAVVPQGWFAKAGSPLVDFGNGFGYGYQWWTYPGDNYGAQGIFGQSIAIVPQSDLVVAVISNWPAAQSSTFRNKGAALVAKIAFSPRE